MNTKKHTILLIEDEKDIGETISEYLTDVGFEIIWAQNGPQGIQKAIQHYPDAIICDINMPGITGYEVFDMLHQINVTSVIPFIFLSAKASKDDILLGLHLGVDDYIPKPFELTELEKTVRKRIETRKRITDLNDEKFHAILNNNFCGMVLLKGQTIEYLNKKFAEMLGYSQQEVSGNSLINFVDKQNIKTISDSISKCEQGATKEFETGAKAIRKDGKTVDILIKGSNIIMSGEKRIVLSCVKTADISNDKVAIDAKNAARIKLSARELEVLALVCAGLTNAQIAEKLFLSERTVEGHRSRLFDKTGTGSAVALAMWAVRNRIIDV